SNGESIPTKTVIWGAGVMGQFPAGIHPEIIQRGNRIQTDGQCRVTGMENVYAIGDVAAMITPDTPRGLPGVAPAAQQQGAEVSKHILRTMNNQQAADLTYFANGSMAATGRNKAGVDMGSFHMLRFLGWLTRMVAHLVSILGSRNKLVTFVN